MTTAVVTETTRVIFKCQRKSCKHAWAYEFEPQGKHLFRMVDGKKVWESDEFFTGCPICHSKFIESNHVEGKVTEHACNAKCMSATNGTCECSCGGRNHGVNHL